MGSSCKYALRNLCLLQSVHEMLSDEALLAKYLFEDKVTLANLKNVGLSSVCNRIAWSTLQVQFLFVLT